MFNLLDPYIGTLILDNHTSVHTYIHAYLMYSPTLNLSRDFTQIPLHKYIPTYVHTVYVRTYLLIYLHMQSWDNLVTCNLSYVILLLFK